MGKTYTGPSLYGGTYYIKDNMIQSGHSAVPEVTSGGNTITSPAGPYGANSVGYSGDREISQGSRNLAAAMAASAGYDSSDFGDYIRELMQVSQNNTAQSQAFAREQMEFQRESDATAMAWSAAEAQKNRDWQERLSNSAHQREVQDLIAAGLNPILAANQGAYTGSGATGQGFSSSGAMGQVDTSLNGAMGALFSTVLNTASQAAIAGMYTDAERYAADMSYASAKTSAEASIYNNNNNIEANKAINAMNNDAALQRANISSAATLGAAGMNAGAIQYSANQAAQAAMYGHDLDYKAKESQSQRNYNLGKYQTDKQYELNTMNNLGKDPVGYVFNTINRMLGPNLPGNQSDYNWSLSNGGS